MLALPAIVAFLCSAPLQPQTPAPAATPPIVVVGADDTKIDRSCIIQIAKGAVIPDVNGDGVIHIVADGITVEFAPEAVLRGAPLATPGDQLTGVGIRLDGFKDVVLKGCCVAGFKVGIQASRCPGLSIDGADLSGNYRQRLKSTAQAEDGSDWLFPHHNDKGEWLTQHGAALGVKEATNVSIRGVTVRDGQNGIVLDRVTSSRVFDNDCSFLSGWGLALWRSSRNLICRNALDFCIRGYSHNVYNRGQDSAGLLMFEQCSENVIAENSITHGGDGIFGFAGIEAIGDTPAPNPAFDYTRRGCNDNVIAANDLSYAAAHGLEMTFSHGNQVVRNRLVANAICGIWGGYSQGMHIVENTFEGNGEMAYGLERGGINIEHGSDNRIMANTFKDNKCGVHLWWDDDAGLLKKPGVVAGGSDVARNVVSVNSFSGDAIALQLRDTSPHKDKVRATVFSRNTMERIARELDAPDGVSVDRDVGPPMYMDPLYTLVGESRPVGARSALAGRQNIVMTEWGPWDHRTPLARAVTTSGSVHRYELFRMPPEARFNLTQSGGMGPEALNVSSSKGEDGSQVVTVAAKKPGVIGYTLKVDSPSYKREFTGSIVRTRWDVIAFAWTGSLNPPKPPENLEAWRALAKGPDTVKVQVEDLAFKFGGGGPRAIKSIPEFASSKLGGSFYGLIATTSMPMNPGKWRVRVASDDGVRVIVAGRTIVENWTHHGPTTDLGEFEVKESSTVPIVVEYFQIGGHAELEFRLEPVP